MNTAYIVLFLLGAYLIGSIPNGCLIVKWKKGIDIRTVASGVTGATNVARVLGWTWGVITIIFDFLKGYIPTSLAVWLWGLHWLTGLAGLLTVIGHIFPALISKPRFKGGKGVATIVGAIIPILILSLIEYPYLWVFIALAAIIVFWSLLLRFFRRMGLASVSLMVAITIFFMALMISTYPSFSPFLFIEISLMAALVLYRHWENIVNLWKGKERVIESN